nr:hypothetical protein DWF04_03905 [Cereibacter sphaeroides f. sp. denitrificans]
MYVVLKGFESKVIPEEKKLCRILSLDGGGAKGFYTLGVLGEVEAMLPRPIYETFDLIFGTSTGSIIGTLLAIGKPVAEIHSLYCKHVPNIMKAKKPHERTQRLREVKMTVFGDDGFDTVLTGLGIVATKWQLETPMIFKSLHTQAHGRRATFVPGFGCKLADAVEASCSAYPLSRVRVHRSLRPARRDRAPHAHAHRLEGAEGREHPEHAHLHHRGNRARAADLRPPRLRQCPRALSSTSSTSPSPTS